MKPHQKTFDRIREAVLPEFRERVADYLVDYETVLQDINAGRRPSLRQRPTTARSTCAA